MTPLVSIITPSYNQAPFLEKTIRSVLAQDYKSIEYLIIDGASTDGSVEIIQRYADKLAWWASKPDSGQSEAINKGFQQAQGEIVAWLNSDDILLPGAISEAVSILQQNPDLGFVFGDAITIDQQGRPINKLTFGDWGLEELMRFRIICQPAVFMRRSVLQEAGFLDPSYHYMLDHHLWIRMARLAPIQYASSVKSNQNLDPVQPSERLSRFWAAARHHPEAKNVAQPEGFALEVFRVLEWMQSQSDLAPLVDDNYPKIISGAYRLNARYLLDGDLPAAALKAYWQSFINWPNFALKHWHRMLYAGFHLAGIRKPFDHLRSRSSERQRKNLRETLRSYHLTTPHTKTSSRDITSLEDWPGLCLRDNC